MHFQNRSIGVDFRGVGSSEKDRGNRTVFYVYADHYRTNVQDTANEMQKLEGLESAEAEVPRNEVRLITGNLC